MILEQCFRVRPHVNAAMEVKGEVLKDVAQPTAGRTSTPLSSLYLLDFCCHLTLVQALFVGVFVSGYECLCRLPVFIAFSSRSLFSPDTLLSLIAGSTLDEFWDFYFYLRKKNPQ